MFETLVVPLDGSPCATHALEFALSTAKAGRSTLDVCSVVDPANVVGSGAPSGMAEGAMRALRQDAQRYVDEALSLAAGAGIRARGCVLVGDPVREIVGYARDVQADAIVMGTHGRRGFQRFLMGSVAEGVLRAASTPVITVREAAKIASPTPAVAEVL